jgi:hypothetical protein
VVLLYGGGAWALGEIKLRPVDWPEESTYEFAIFDQQHNRLATAYYRLLSEQTNGRPVYHIKYVGRNEQVSEAAECWIDRLNLFPLRSTRKVVSGGRAFFQDYAYSNGVITIRRKYEGEQVYETTLPAPGPVYDYEELLWLIPQLDFSTQNQLYINVLVTISGNLATVGVTDLGIQPLIIQNQTYNAHGYSFDVNMTAHMLWTVMQDGRPVPARFDTGGNTFINLELDPARAGTAAVTPAPAEEAAAEPTEEEPAEEAEEEEQEEEEEPEPSDPNVNPLGPPPPGSRF